MSGANQVQATIQLNAGFTFNGTGMSGNLIIFPNSTSISFSPINLSNTVTSSFTNLSGGFLSPGPHNLSFQLFSVSSGVNGSLVNGSSFGTITFLFNDNPNTVVGPLNLVYNGPGDSALTANTGFNINCLHGSSLIQMKNGNKRLDQIREGDEVLSGDNLDQYTQVKGISQCWLSFMGVDHDAIIFEPNSLGDNEPTQQLIIDPGHPICTKKEYLEKGIDALRPAGSFWEELKGDKVYTKKWTDIFVQNEPSVRYDLILEEPFNTYIANGMVVRAKGYNNHRYKRFV